MWVILLAIFYMRIGAEADKSQEEQKVTFPQYLKESIENNHIDRIGNMTRELIMGNRARRLKCGLNSLNIIANNFDNNYCIAVQNQYHFKRFEGDQLPNFVIDSLKTVSDVKGKNKNLQKINDKYKEAQDFQLGIISAVVQSSFKDLLIVYSDYCRLEVFENNTYETSEYLVAYHFMQGQFNDLKFQKNIYFDIKEGFVKRKKFLDILGKQLHNRYGTDRGRLGQLQRLPEEVVNDKKNLARELIIRDIAPRRADLLEVESLVERSVNIEKITRRSNSYTTDEGQRFDVVASMWNKLLKNLDKI